MIDAANPSTLMGSPPRVRGTVLSDAKKREMGRITPACAGNSESREIPGVAVEDHPRVCGEQTQIIKITRGIQGSPPRVRGTGPGFLRYGRDEGITPACAGNRPRLFCFLRAIRDHPRVCGEQDLMNILLLCKIGSPPRVRGTAPPRPAGTGRKRITPACAGNSISS